MSVAQPRFEMETQSEGPYAGRAAANAIVDLNLADQDLDFALAGIEPSGAITMLLGSRADFQRALAESVNGRPINNEGGGRFRLAIDLDHRGWSGLLLVSGRGPFPPALVSPPIGERGPDWQGALLGAAANFGWRTEMVWFESVDRRPDAAAPADGDKDDF
jgi:serine/threonine-protein kinase